MKVKRQIFPNPINAAEEEGVDPVQDFMSTFGINNEPAAPTDPTPPSEPEADPEQTAPEKTEPEKTEPEQIEPQPDKAAQAFAQMRVQNKQYEKLLAGMAQVLGVDAKDPESITQALNSKVTEAQAKQQNIPVDILNRLQQLEEQNSMFNQEQVRRQAYLGFQNVKNKFGLDDKALNSFAETLVADNMNPFESPLDLETEYIKRNYQTLVAQAEARGAQAEAQRAANANKNGTVPNPKQGQPLEEPDKITSISDLDKWLNNHKK